MRNHPDDDDIPPTLNKTIKETYGVAKSISSKELPGVPPASNNHDCDLESTMETAGTSSDGKTVLSTELQGVPCTSTATALEPTNKPNEKSGVNDVTSTETTGNSELCGVLDDKDIGYHDTDLDTNETDVPATPSNTVADDYLAPQTRANTDKDDSTVSADSNLPEIEKTKRHNNENNDQEINLQLELNSENVTQPNTELLEELSEFSNLLNLDDDYMNTDLPVMGDSNRNEPAMDAGLDLKITMDNAKFLEANPLHGRNISSSGSAGKRSDTVARLRPSQRHGTTSNSMETRIQSPKGTVHITKHYYVDLPQKRPRAKNSDARLVPTQAIVGHPSASIMLLTIHRAIVTLAVRCMLILMP